MKKFFTLVFALIMCLGCGIGLVACGNGNKIAKAEVQSGIPTTIVKGAELDTDNVVVKVTYSDGTTETITSADLEFGEFDTNRLGTYDLSVTYKKEKFTFNVKIKIVATEADVASIMSLESDLWNEYNAYRTFAGQSNEDERDARNTFKDQAQPLYVGDDNAFNFRLNATGLDANGNRVANLTDVRTNVTIKRNGVELTGDELAQYVSVNTIGAVLDFTQAAVGKTFEVTVAAANREEGYTEAQTRFTATLTIVDGFNVYDALDLSVYDNKYDYLSDARKLDSAKNHHGYVAMHQQVAEKYGMTLDEIANIKSIILQNDIKVLASDVPSDFFWAETPSWSQSNLPVAGSLLNYDCEGVYYRFVEPTQTFNFIGNYFGVDASEFPRCVLQTTNPTASNSLYVSTEEGAESYMDCACMTLFYTTGIDYSETGRTEAEGAEVNWKNLSCYGNGVLNANPENSGAILLSKFTKCDMTAYNNITIGYYIDYLVRKYNDTGKANKSTFLINKCKGYDSYQCLIYVAGTDNGTIVRDSEFKGSNGPAIICDCIVNTGDETQNIPVNLDIINSTIESKVTGKEPWFATYNASQIVAGIAANEQYFDGTAGAMFSKDKSIVAGTIKGEHNEIIPQLNASVLLKADTTNIFESHALKGCVRFFEGTGDTEAAKSESAYAKYQAQDDLQQAFYVALGTLYQQHASTIAAITDDEQKLGYVIQNIIAPLVLSGDYDDLVFGLDYNNEYCWLDPLHNLGQKAQAGGFSYLQGNLSGGFLGTSDEITYYGGYGADYADGNHLNMYSPIMGLVLELYPRAA